MHTLAQRARSFTRYHWRGNACPRASRLATRIVQTRGEESAREREWKRWKVHGGDEFTRCGSTPFNESHRRRTGPGSLGNLGDFERIESRDFLLCTRGVFVVFQVSTFQALNRFIACPLPRAVYYFTTSFPFLVVSGDGLLTFPFSSMCIFSLVADTR